MARTRSLAVAQTCPVAGDIQANMDEHILLARLAAKGGASLVVFPELSLMGYELRLADQLAFTEGDARLNPLRDTARSLNLTIVAGAALRLGPSLHIGAFILQPDGQTQVYTKHRLGAFPPSASCDSVTGDVPPAEATVFQPGDRNPLVPHNSHLAAIAVCADIGRPAHVEQAAGRGADLYLASMFVIPSDFDGDVEKLSRYARQYKMMTAFANFGCPSGGLRSAGRSSIWSDTGELVVQLGLSGSGVAIVTDTAQGLVARTFTL